jgi:transforming growth factor-beta-induced protein
MPATRSKSMLLRLFALALAVLLVAAACGSDDDNSSSTESSDNSSESEDATSEDVEDEEMADDVMADIVDTAVDAGDFTTLVAAVEAAGLVDTLKGEGPFTVFAPTDAAFAALPEGTVEALLADAEALTGVLTYHVVDGKVLAEDVVTLDSAETLNGQSVTIEVVDGGVVLNGDANVIVTDIETSNGVIHVIDAVLIPADA